jgi:hypothetical protein
VDPGITQQPLSLHEGVRMQRTPPQIFFVFFAYAKNTTRVVFFAYHRKEYFLVQQGMPQSERKEKKEKYL